MNKDHQNQSQNRRTLKNILFIILIGLTLNSCNQATEKEASTPDVKQFDSTRVIVDNLYSIKLPTFLSKATSLHPDASLQFQNPEKEFYVIVINESQEEVHKAIVDNNLTELYTEDLTGYAKLLLDNLYSAITFIDDTNLENVEINSLESKTINIEGTVSGEDIFYIVAYIKGKTNYYSLTTWTLLDRKEEHMAEMQKMINSFEEI